MTEIDLKQYLSQIHHSLDGMRNPDDKERDKEIDAIQYKIRQYIEGVTKVHSKQMASAIMASLEELAPVIERFAQTAFGNEKTDPDITIVPASEKRLK